MKMVKNEWKHIWKNKLMLLTFAGMLCIPILYAGFFLKSVWDPYGNTSELPIAVVNEDQPLTNEMATFNVGDDLVESLQKNHDMNWIFTTATEAQEGLDDQKYYMIVTIPQDFSKNAATVLDKNPQQMEIDYKTNGSHNFIGEVMGSAGIKALKAEVSEKVTHAYVDAVVSNFDSVKDGVLQAADGSKKLSDGVDMLASGSTEISSGLEVLSNSTLQFTDGVHTFDVGLTQYVSGVKQVDNGMATLSHGVDAIDKNIPTLTDGVHQLTTGSNELAKGVNTYTTGVDMIAQGTSELSKNGSALQLGMEQTFLQIGVVLGQAGTSTQALNDGVTAIKVSVTNSKDLQTLKSNLTSLQTSINQLEKNKSANQDENVTDASTQDFSTIITSIDETIAAIEALEEELETDKQGAIDSILKSEAFTNLTEEEQSLLGAVIETEVNTISLSSSMDLLTASLNGTTEQLSTIELPQSVAVETSAVSSDIEAVIASANKLIPETTTTLDQIIGAQPGLETIDEGLQELSQGLEEAKIQTTAGGTILNTNMTNYVGGVKKVDGGMSALQKNNQQLVEGSAQLSNGLNQFDKNIPTLIGGIDSAKSGINQIAKGTGALALKGNDLVSGGTAIEQASSQLNDGAEKLAAGGRQLTSGVGSVQSGSNELALKLGEGNDKVASIQLTDKNSEQIAAPVEIKQEKQSDVQNYGHALAPYVMSLALFMGCIVFNYIYPIRKIAMKGQSSFAWFASKFTVGFVAATSMGLIEATVMLLLGLNVINIGAYYAMIIVAANAFMFLVMFLSMFFDNIGRFVAVILLVLQLAASGGTFPMEVTSKFFNSIHPFLPMTYSIKGLRQAITGGLGHAVFFNNLTALALLFIVSSGLLLASMMYLQRIHKAGKSGLDDNQILQGLLNI